APQQCVTLLEHQSGENIADFLAVLALDNAQPVVQPLLLPAQAAKQVARACTHDRMAEADLIHVGLAARIERGKVLAELVIDARIGRAEPGSMAADRQLVREAAVSQ